MYNVVGYLRTRLRALPRTQRGASAMEYGLLIALVSIVMVGGVALLGHNLGDAFGSYDTSRSTGHK